MKNIKKYTEFINENYNKTDIDIPERNDIYNYLLNVTKKCGYENTYNFFVKTPIEIGKVDNKYKLYLNYLDSNHYEEKLSYWVIYNEQPCNLNGTKWDSGVIWEEDGKLVYSEKHNTIELFPDFITIIYNEISKYSDLDEWCEHIKNVGITRRKYHRWAIQSSHKKKEDRTELTWDEEIERAENSVESDRLLNRYSEPYEQRSLDEMLKLGEDEWKRINDEKNKRITDIINKMDFKK